MIVDYEEVVACQTFLVVVQNQGLEEVLHFVVIAFAMVELRMENLVVEVFLVPELKMVGGLKMAACHLLEVLKKEVVLLVLALLVDYQKDLHEMLTWFVEQVAVQLTVLVYCQLEDIEDHLERHVLVQRLADRYSSYHCLVAAQADRLSKGWMQTDQDEDPQVDSLSKKVEVQAA